MKEPKEKAYLEFCHWDEKVRITLDHHDITISDAYDKFKRLLMAAGFSESQIDEYLDENI
jgi:virulence-associated protein VapD